VYPVRIGRAVVQTGRIIARCSRAVPLARENLGLCPQL